METNLRRSRHDEMLSLFQTFNAGDHPGESLGRADHIPNDIIEQQQFLSQYRSRGIDRSAEEPSKSQYRI